MTADKPAVLVHDPTLRDGHHAVGHQLDAGQLRDCAAAADRAGVPVVEVGHGLGASSLQIGRAKLSDSEMLSTVREALTSARMGVFMGPGWGTSDGLRGALRHGAQVFRIAAHRTEADVTERHLGFVAEHGGQAQGVLMMSHMAGPSQLAEQCALMAGFGAIANKNDELAQLKADVEGFLAENTRLTLENQEMRDVLSGNTTNVIPLRPAPHR